MVLRLLRAVLWLTLGGMAIYVGCRVVGQRREERRLDTPVTNWPDVPLPARDDAADPGPAPVDVSDAVLELPDPSPAAPDWVEAVDGACPDTHPVKVKLRSSLYHLPGMLAYDRTKPDRCYATAAAADRDGFTRARR